MKATLHGLAFARLDKKEFAHEYGQTFHHNGYPEDTGHGPISIKIHLIPTQTNLGDHDP